MRQQRWGRILTSTSSGVISPIPALAMSNTLRAALVNWSKTLATEVAQHGITANILVPGKILTDRLRFLDEFTAGKKDLPVQSVVDANEGAIPAKRYGTPGEYAAAAAFLASARASYITGTIVRVDGGAIASI
jgi:3-oxoacyl-[acyl-carrier protein] reductase